ncbi:TPA: hypothetical protein N0F65_005435 [Lagenidium giganteum]|uniref:Uncharacterized protein n=1 Tax=Lagenidium giganteum TaxID=4803 RepID=A0AAV2Z1L0_9STRA|nr:TPA: hypothetical protein N0F65_005435 [Lagenidium giganteum]
MKHHLGLRATIEAVEDVKRQIAQSSYLQQALAAVEEQMLDLVRTSATIGPLYILTKLSMPAMEAICAACFPRVAFWLTNVNSFPNFHRVQVVAATAALKTSVEFTSWRVKVFQQICRDQGANYGPTLRGSTQALQVAESGAFSLISVTTSEADVFACVKTIDIAPFLVPKCIRVRGVQCNHSLEDFYAHLRTLQMYIQTSAAHPTAFSTTL